MASRTPRRRTRRRPRASRILAAPEPQLTIALRDACTDLVELGARFALVGGLAVSARAEPRLTRDVDLAIAAENDTAAEDLVRRLIARGYRMLATVEHTKTKRLATVRLGAPTSELLVDLLFASCGIETTIVDAAEALEILPGLTVPVARAAHLIAMKLLARDDRDRPQDADDIQALVPTLDARERKRVATAITEIERRGFARGRDLVADWKPYASAAGKKRNR